MKASEELALSLLQKVDIQGSIRFVLDNIKNPQSRLILLNYFLGDDNNSKAVTEDEEAFEALQEMLEGEFLQAKTWLNSPFFKSKQGDREPGPRDLAKAIVECLEKLRAEDTQTAPEKNLDKYNHSVIFQYFQLAKP